MTRYLIIFSCLVLAVEAYGQEFQNDVYFPEVKDTPEHTQQLAKGNFPLLIEKADALYNQNEFEKAAEIYSQVIRTRPYDANAYFGRANCREHLGNFEGALADFRSVHYLAPEMTEAYFSSAVLEYNLGDYRAAVPLFEKLLELPEGSTQAIYFKGVQYSPHAQPVLTGVESMADDKNLIVYHYLGKCYGGLREYQKAEENYSRAIALGPSAELHVDRGLMRRDGFSRDMAIADFQAALNLQPNNSLALYWLSYLAEESGNESLTIAALDKVLAGNQAFPEAFIQRGTLKYKTSEYRQAIADFDNAIALTTEIPEAYINRGLAKDKTADLQGALRDFTLAIKMNPTDAQAFQYRGNTYFKMKKYEEAVKDYNMSINLDKQNAKLFYNRALAKNNMRNDLLEGEVCTDLQKAIELGMEEAIAAREDICEGK